MAASIGIIRTDTNKHLTAVAVPEWLSRYIADFGVAVVEAINKELENEQALLYSGMEAIDVTLEPVKSLSGSELTTKVTLLGEVLCRSRGGAIIRVSACAAGYGGQSHQAYLGLNSNNCRLQLTAGELSSLTLIVQMRDMTTPEVTIKNYASTEGLTLVFAKGAAIVSFCAEPSIHIKPVGEKDIYNHTLTIEGEAYVEEFAGSDTCPKFDNLEFTFRLEPETYL